MRRWIKRIPKVRRLAEPRGIRPRIPALSAEVEGDRPQQLRLEDPQVGELRRLLGDDPATMRMIRRILRLRERLPGASLPELIAYDWLQQRRIPFEFQGEALGGRLLRGGQIPDFVIRVGPGVLVWRIQGEYWHTRPGKREDDFVDKMRILSGTIYGQPVWAVVDCWESDIYQDPERVFRLAIAGIGLRE